MTACRWSYCDPDTCAGCGTTSDTDTPPDGWIEHYGVYGCDACRVGFRGDEDVEVDE